MSFEITLDGNAIYPSKDTYLEGENIILKPIEPELDCEELFNASHGEHAWIWTFLFDGPYSDLEEFKKYLQRSVNDTTKVGLTVVNKKDMKKIGIVHYLNISPEHKRIELGSIWYSPPFHRTYANSESTYLLTKHAFEVLGYRRVEWKCDYNNERSKKAALAMGFVFEGIFRSHMIIKGRNRDTAWFSIIDKEWEQVKKKF